MRICRMRTIVQRLKSAALNSLTLCSPNSIVWQFCAFETHLMLQQASATASSNYVHSFLLFCSSCHGANSSKLNSIILRKFKLENARNFSFWHFARQLIRFWVVSLHGASFAISSYTCIINLVFWIGYRRQSSRLKRVTTADISLPGPFFLFLSLSKLKILEKYRKYTCEPRKKNNKNSLT